MRLPSRNRPVSKNRGRPFMLIVGALGILVAFLFVYIGFHAPTSIPGRSYYKLHAVFNNANNLEPHAAVRARGERIGQVLDPHVDHGRAVINLQLTAGTKLRSDTTMRVRQRSAVGVRFVEVTPGTKGHFLPSGATVPASQTSTSVSLGLALRTLDERRRAEAQTDIDELGNATFGGGQIANREIQTTRPFLHHTATLSDAIVARTGAVRSFIQGGAGAAAAADPVREAIATGFHPEAQALDPFSRHADTLRQTLDVAPGALGTLSAQLPRTDPVLEQVAGLARAALPALRAAPVTLNDATALFVKSRPGLKAAPKTLQLAKDAVPPVLSALRSVHPILPDVETTLSNTDPLLSELAPRGCDIITWGTNWTDLIGLGNANGNYVRFDLTPGSQTLAGQTNKSQLAVPADEYPAPCVAKTEHTKFTVPVGPLLGGKG
jgi:ABC-type transporter Mla subunit MlaD